MRKTYQLWLYGTLLLAGAAAATANDFIIPATTPQAPADMPLAAGVRTDVKPLATLAPSVKAPATAELKTVVDEDFALWTEGSETEPMSVYYIDGFLAEDMSHILSSRMKGDAEGWWCSDAGAANGICSLGTTSEMMGSITTPKLTLAGNVTVTCRVKNQCASKKNLLINGLYGDDMYSPSFIDMETACFASFIQADGEWHDITMTFYCDYTGADCFIQFQPMGKMLIDDIRVTVLPSETIPAPALQAATDFTANGFTAHWQEVPDATSYLISCYGQRTVGDGNNVTITESFEDINQEYGHYDWTADPNLPEGWDIKVGTDDESEQVITDPSKASDGNQALILSSDGDYVITPDNGGRILEFTCDLRHLRGKYNLLDEMGIDPSDPEYQYYDQYWEYGGTIYFEGWDGYQWKEIFFTNFSEQHDGAYVTNQGFSVFGSKGKYSRIRLRCDEFDDHKVQVALDNVQIVTTTPTEKIWACTDLEVKGTEYTFTSLPDPELDYYYYVKAYNSEKNIDSGDPTSCIDAFGVATPESLAGSDIDQRGAFTANWKYTPKATSYRPRLYDVYVAPEDENEAVIFHETFSKIQTSATLDEPATLANLTLMEMDNLTDNIGWTGYLNGFIDGALGVIGMFDYKISGLLSTPELSLGNDGGSCVVTVTACATVEGEYMSVVNQTGTNGFWFPLTRDWQTGYQVIENCVDNDRISFATRSASPAFISEVTVTQNLKKDDKVHSMIQYPTVTDLSNRFSGLEPKVNHLYAFDVMAYYNRGGQTTQSAASAKQYVDFGTSVQGIPADDNGIAVVTEPGCVVVLSMTEANVTITDLAGRTVVSAIQPEGTGRYPLAEGIYIVKAADSVAKVMVK